MNESTTAVLENSLAQKTNEAPLRKGDVCSYDKLTGHVGIERPCVYTHISPSSVGLKETYQDEHVFQKEVYELANSLSLNINWPHDIDTRFRRLTFS